jgi:putative lipoprotein (rSAM/lipoprotein system)
MLLGALLPSACDENPTDPPTPEYGVPQATVKLDGVVVDERGAPVRDIRLELEGFGSATSDTLGVFSLSSTGFASCVVDSQLACGLEATDVDGPDNGMYEPTMVVLDLQQSQPGSGWDLGTFEQHDIEVVMPDIGLEYGPICAAIERLHRELGES